MNDKRFYWIKLKTNFFEQDAIDFLLSQPNGSDYIALYLKLCTMTANTNGQLATQIGEILIPYDAQKIARDTKYFSVDTVVVAMELFKKLGLIYESSDNILQIAEYENMVGSSKMDEHTKKLNSERQRRFRENQKAIGCNVTVTDNVTLNSNAEIRDKSIEIRDKSIEIRDKDKDICFDKSKQTKHKYGEYHHVLLDDNQYERLKKLYGDSLNEHIRILDEYIETSGKRYKNHSLVIQKWVHERYLKDHKNNEHVQLDSKFYTQESNQTQEEIEEEMERVRKEILGNVA